MTAVANKQREASASAAQTGLPRVRVSGIVPAMKGAVSLPPLGASATLIGARTRTPPSKGNAVAAAPLARDDAHEWQAALERARANVAHEQAAERERARAAAEEEEWAWREALVRAKARAQVDESREWSVHIARARSVPVPAAVPERHAKGARSSAAQTRVGPPQGRLVFWP